MKKPQLDAYGWIDGEYVDNLNPLFQEMLDALIEAHELTDHFLKFEDDNNMKQTLGYKIDKIESALKKAGVKL